MSCELSTCVRWMRHPSKFYRVKRPITHTSMRWISFAAHARVEKGGKIEKKSRTLLPLLGVFWVLNFLLGTYNIGSWKFHICFRFCLPIIVALLNENNEKRWKSILRLRLLLLCASKMSKGKGGFVAWEEWLPLDSNVCATSSRRNMWWRYEIL